MAAMMADLEHDVEEQYEPYEAAEAGVREEKPRRSRPSSRRGRSFSDVGRSISRSRSRANTEDIAREYRVRGEDLREEDDSSSSGHDPNEKPALSLTKTESKNFVFFSEGDPESPYNWSQTRKIVYVLICIVAVLNSTLSSALPSESIPELTEHYNVTVPAQEVLPTSVFLMGYVFGPLIFAPLSESYGRQYIMIGTFVCYTLCVLGTCLSPSWAGFLILRWLGGVFASCPISVTGGVYADLYNDPVSRGRAMAMFMSATTWGPIFSPIASGYLGYYGYRWPYWFTLIFAGISLVMLFFLPETYGPVILQRRARKIRKEHPGMNIWAPIDFEKSSFKDLVKIFLGRPFRMLFFEPVVYLSCAYMAIIYAIFYIFLQAFAFIYQPIYNFNLGEVGLAFVPIGVGSLFACVLYLWWDAKLYRAKAQGKAWADKEEFRRLPLGCIGGPFLAIGMFWIGWSARSDVHWIVPMLGGLPFGFAFLLLFMSLTNYLVDAYEIFAASALAAASASRSLFGSILPFAARPMYNALGVAWACSLLGFISAALCIIPFAFLKYGSKIRANSKFCQELEERRKQRDEVNARRLRRAQEKLEAAQSSQEDPGKVV